MVRKMSKYTKEQLFNKVDEIKEELLELSHEVHSHPEITSTEHFACKLLSDYVKAKGFEVTVDVAGHDTAFIAIYDTGKEGPNVAITAEYDALPGIGHGCGHNVIGASSVGAAVVLKETIEFGKVALLGTPGEEGGPNGSSKGSFVREGYLDDIDFSLSIHPSGQTRQSSTSLACRVLEVEYFGQTAHAAGSPENGINALDALINFYNQINALRQQLTDDIRIHGVILDGGLAPNVIPDYTRARFFVRAKSKKGASETVEKFKIIAKAASDGAFTTHKVTEIQNAVDNLVPNRTLDNVVTDVFKDLGLDVKEPSSGEGSTDVGNISHVVPTVHPNVKIGPDDLVGHTVEFAACARDASGDKGLLDAAKAIVVSTHQVFDNPKLLAEIKQEFEQTREK